MDKNFYHGEKFVIKTENNSAANKFIQSAKLNGKSLDKPWFYHKELINGGYLQLIMGSEANKNWGSDPEDAPLNMSQN